MGGFATGISLLCPQGATLTRSLGIGILSATLIAFAGCSEFWDRIAQSKRWLEFKALPRWRKIVFMCLLFTILSFLLALAIAVISEFSSDFNYSASSDDFEFEDVDFDL